MFCFPGSNLAMVNIHKRQQMVTTDPVTSSYIFTVNIGGSYFEQLTVVECTEFWNAFNTFIDATDGDIPIQKKYSLIHFLCPILIRRRRACKNVCIIDNHCFLI
jgi:hypothetical protein